MGAKITKIKNDPSRYLTRKSLALSAFSGSACKRDSGHERREASGVLDTRWYILLPKRSNR